MSNKKYSNTCNNHSKSHATAFTLAEVLIVIGIIGVIAAITLSVIIKNYQKYSLRQQFLTNYSILSQAVNKAQYDMGYIPNCWYWDTGTFSNDTGTGGQGKFGDCNTFVPYFLKNLKIIKTCSDNSVANGCIADIKGYDTLKIEENPEYESSFCLNESKTWITEYSDSYVLANGAYIINLVPEEYNGTMNFNVFALDVNGQRGPNKWGYDIFELALWNNDDKSIKIRYGVCQPTEAGGTSVIDMLTGN